MKLFNLHNASDKTGTGKPITFNIFINNIPIACELDTGSKYMVISEKLYYEKFRNFSLRSNQKFGGYDGQRLKTLGCFRPMADTKTNHES